MGLCVGFLTAPSELCLVLLKCNKLKEGYMKKYHILTKPTSVEEASEWDLSNIASEGLLMLKAQKLQARRWKKLRQLEA